jgi:hypothetical protein
LPEEPGATNCTADVALPNTTLLVVNVVAPVPPLATGKVPVTLAVRLTKVADVVPVPPLATGRVPVTPVVNGRPVALVNAAYEGVPILGVTKAGLVANTNEPEPVSSDTTEANWAEVVAANWLRLPPFISFTADTILLVLVVVNPDNTPILLLVVAKLVVTKVIRVF